MYILNVVKNIFSVLDPRSKRQYIALQLFFFLAAIFQVLGIASIGPFIAIVSNPDIIHTNAVLATAYEMGNFTGTLPFIIAAAIFSLVMILVSNLVAGMTIWFTFTFSVALGSRLQKRVYHSFLFRSYLYHKTKNYNYLISVVSQQIPRFVYMLLQPFLLLTAQLFVAAIILLGLLVLDPVLASIAGLIIGGSYLATYIYVRKSLAMHGEIVSQRASGIQSILSESFIGIKDIKLGSMENKYLNQFDDINSKGLKSQASISLKGEIPKFIIESISFGSILLLALVLLTTRDEISSVVPILSIYALAGYRLLPTMQQIYKSVSSLSGHGAVAKVIREELKADSEEQEQLLTSEPMKLERIELENAFFSYPASGQMAVDNVSLSLERGYIYSLAGHSGSGKSTLADLILGLLKLDSGRIIVNRETLTQDRLAAFRNSLSYVAQNIFILDDTVIKNVAFGIPEECIDIDRAMQALEMANANEFVKDLPKGIYTNLGQDGKLLSGGQRQRIGIARALYKQSDLLVLDEPTSALDMDSEYKLLETLNKIKENLIILVISHRPASIKMSDKVVIMDSGCIRSIGSYDELTHTDEKFRAMIEKGSIA